MKQEASSMHIIKIGRFLQSEFYKTHAFYSICGFIVLFYFWDIIMSQSTLGSCVYSSYSRDQYGCLFVIVFDCQDVVGGCVWCFFRDFAIFCNFGDPFMFNSAKFLLKLKNNASIQAHKNLRVAKQNKITL